MTSDNSSLPFRPALPDFSGFPMPSSVPAGLRLELSRSRILPGRAREFDEWMDMLNERYDECVETLSDERAVFEATFRSDEADGSTWIYHLSLVGEGGSGLDESNPIDADHAAYARRTKEAGWEELQPKFLVTPDHIRDAMIIWGRSGHP